MYVVRFQFVEPLVYLPGEVKSLAHVEVDRGRRRRGRNVELPGAIRSCQVRHLIGEQSAYPLIPIVFADMEKRLVRV